VSEKPLEMRHFQVFMYTEEPELASLPGPLELLGIERNETNRSQLVRLDVESMLARMAKRKSWLRTPRR
jgi:hypothetical protein